MKINWAVRVKNPWFWIGLVGVILSPVLTAMGMTQADLTSWTVLFDVLKKLAETPYLIAIVISAVLGFLGVTNDATTKGLSDSNQAMTYSNPREN